MKVSGNTLIGRTLKRLGVDAAFYLMGAPLLEAENACIREGIRMIDVRHEQAAAMMAHAYARVSGKPGVCLAGSGPGVTNLTTGLANALVDGAPVVALGGSSNMLDYGMGSFQEIDQVAIMRPITKWAERVYDTARIPEYVEIAFRQARSGKPGPVYLDIPGDVLYREVDERDVTWAVTPHWTPARPRAEEELVAKAAELIKKAKQPIILSGSGTLWSGASARLLELVELTGIPVYATPQGRGVIPEDHPCCFNRARSTAFREADVVIVAGTRLNYVVGYGKPPRFNAAANFVHIDIDPYELSRRSQSGISLLGDVGTVLNQLQQALTGECISRSFEAWRQHLSAIDNARRGLESEKLLTDQVPIHPLRLCKELREFIDRDAVLVVDGQEILNYGRQTIPSFVPGHRLNSGPFGTMGVGLPFALGAKAAKPETQVIVLHGDGSFGMNGIELDTAVRHNLPVLVVVSLNGGWTAYEEDRPKPGRELGYTQFHKFAQSLGCYAEQITEPEDVRPALERAKKAMATGTPALLNVVTDSKARAKTVKFAQYET